MVAIIKTGHSIKRILNYNENKVKEKVAVCIAAFNFPIDVEKLYFTQKLNRLANQSSLNENVKRNSVHVSLNFDPSERLSNEQLKSISESYMQRIGFGDQPYLVYQHFDAGHPHIHIVSIKVRADGSRIDMQNIGRNQSEKARKEIEQEYGLVIAGSNKDKKEELKPAYVSKVLYGKSESRQAIGRVLDAVVDTYKYTSLPELNAILQRYNVIADKGNESSRVFKNQGLLYRIIDEKGEKIGVPIKASSFHNQPTLKFLQSKFKTNEAGRQPHKARVKNAIDLALLRNPKHDLGQLIQTLEKDGIHTVLRKNADELVYGITYVDYRTQCVFNGSALGKEYSANAIHDRCGHPLHTASKNQETPDQQELAAVKKASTKQGFSSDNSESLIDILFLPETSFSYVPTQLPGKRRKKKKKGISK